MTGKEFCFCSRWFGVRFALLTLAQNLLSLLLGGEECVRCSRLAVRIPLCRRCLPAFWRTEGGRSCSCCGKSLLSESDVCSRCRESPALRSIDRAFSLHSYQLWRKSLLFAWKMEGKRGLSVYFASVFQKKLREIEAAEGTEIAVVPVPPRAGKIRERGWDQVEEMCFYLERGWNVRVLRLLERLSSVQQKKLGRTQRIDGIETSYRLRSGRKIRKICPMMPATLVLADDVMTTGSTLEACARELRRLGVRRVFSITLFAVD